MPRNGNVLARVNWLPVTSRPYARTDEPDGTNVREILLLVGGMIWGEHDGVCLDVLPDVLRTEFVRVVIVWTS